MLPCAVVITEMPRTIYKQRIARQESYSCTACDFMVVLV